MSRRRIAVLIDGGFFLKRLPRLVPETRCSSPEGVAQCISELCRNHIREISGDDGPRWLDHLYRTFFYDAAPYTGTAHHPIANRLIEFTKSRIAADRRALFETLRRQRKLALRLGKVTRHNKEWTLEPGLTKPLLKTRDWMRSLGALSAIQTGGQLLLTSDQASQLAALQALWTGLDESAVSLNLRQKGVDMRIGIDIASLALKRQVDTIVLVAGDSDFVPAAKLARREGIDLILDPLGQSIEPDLHEHIDGIQSGLPRPAEPKSPEATAAPAAPAPETE